ncbi:MAG: hypothetical protein QGG36_29360 [Pirellulaceae bacterium]|nr:hypothetical protein [Pirellulaceae bacterium]
MRIIPTALFSSGVLLNQPIGAESDTEIDSEATMGIPEKPAKPLFDTSDSWFRERVAAAFTRILWGAVLVQFHFRINQFDLLIDAVGFGLLALGAGELARGVPSLARARRMALVGLFASIPLAVEGLTGDLETFLGLAQQALFAGVLWWLMLACQELFSGRDLRPARHADILRWLVVARPLVAAAALADFSPGVAGGIFHLVVSVWVLYYFVQSRRAIQLPGDILQYADQPVKQPVEATTSYE